MPHRCAPILVLLAASLGGCGAERGTSTSAAAVDPATRLALEAPLLVDPGLDTQSRRFAVMSDPAPLDGSLPLDDFAPATVVAARAEARQLGGSTDAGALEEVPCTACAAPTLTQRSAALGGDCGNVLVADLAQGSLMPAAMPIFPRAHLREAGIARGPCKVRAASFTAPVGSAEALDFYRVLATKSGFKLATARGKAMAAVFGQRATDGARFVVIARSFPGQTSQVDLIVAGF